MKYKLTYYLNGQSELFSDPNIYETDDLQKNQASRCDSKGKWVQDCQSEKGGGVTGWPG